MNWWVYVSLAMSVTAAGSIAYLMAELSVSDASIGDYGRAAFSAAVSAACVAACVAILIGAVNTAGVN